MKCQTCVAYAASMHRVLVVGTPRGGTTWVARALTQEHDVHYVHEPDGTHEPFAFRARRGDRLAHYPVLRPETFSLQYTRLWNGVFAGGRLPRSPADVAARRAFRGVTGDQKRRAAGDGTRTLRLRIAEALAQPRVADPSPSAIVAKSVNAALAAEWIWTQFRPVVVVVRRDLRNVLASWNALGFRGPGEAAFAPIAAEARRRWDVAFDPGDDGLSRSAALCAVMTAALHDDAARHGWVVVDHEDACVDPLGVLASAAEAAGLKWTERATSFVRTSDREGSGYETARVASELPSAWRHRLSSDELRAIDGVVTRLPESLQDIVYSA